VRVHHLNAGALGTTRLVHDDRDRWELVSRLVAALGDGLLAYCLMDTHVHVVAEGPGLEGVLRGYARYFNARHRRTGPLLRGPVVAIPAPGVGELGRMIRYVHENPLKTREPLVGREIEYEWSSARAFAGLSRATYPNVARVRGLVGRRFGGEPRVDLAGLEQARVPCAGPELILGAASQAFGVEPREVAGRRLAPALVAARAVYVFLGNLESYSDAQLAPYLGRARSRLTQLALGPIDLEGVRIARTLLRDPGLRSRLPTPVNGKC
jgi:hypothetical protein